MFPSPYLSDVIYECSLSVSFNEMHKIQKRYIL